jgi:hypothetical protein
MPSSYVVGRHRKYKMPVSKLEVLSQNGDDFLQNSKGHTYIFWIAQLDRCTADIVCRLLTLKLLVAIDKPKVIMSQSRVMPTQALIQLTCMTVMMKYREG